MAASACHHPEASTVEDHHTGDVICRGCGLVLHERQTSVEVVVDVDVVDGGHRVGSDLAFRISLSEACQLMGLPAANLLIDQTVDKFKKYCSNLNYENKTFPTKKPILAYAFHRTLAEHDIHRLPCFFAGLFDLPPRRLLQAEKLVCEAMNMTPLYVPPSFLIESVCRWLHLKAPLISACRDFCRKVEAIHFGKNPESLVYVVLQAVSLRLPLIYPNSGQTIDMNEVKNVFRMGKKPRLVKLDPVLADVHLRRYPPI
jgi:hypothetical protein